MTGSEHIDRIQLRPGPIQDDSLPPELLELCTNSVATTSDLHCHDSLPPELLELLYELAAACSESRADEGSGSLLERCEYAVEVAGVLAGLVTATLSACSMVEDGWGVLGWLVSVGFGVRLFSASRGNAERASPRPSIILRVSLAGVAVFCFTMLAAMLAAFTADPQAIGRAEEIVVLIFVVFGLLCGAFAIRMTWK